MLTFISRAMAGALLLVSSAHAAGIDGPITTTPDIPYVRGPEAAAQVLGTTCNWQNHFMTMLVKFSRGQLTASNTPDPAEQLFLRADHSASDRVGTKGQPQWIEIMGRLVRRGHTVGEFSFIHETDEDALSNCSAVNGIAKDLADDVYDWLKNPGPGVTIAADMPMLKPNTVEPEVQALCPLTRMLPHELTTEVENAVQRTTRDLSTVSGRTLHLKIVSSQLTGSNIYTGGKWIKVTGSLIEDQRERGNFIALRNTSKDKKSCDVADRLSEEMSKDILKWLRKPRPNSRLGDADQTTTAEQ